MEDKMKKYRVEIQTTSSEFLPTCLMDEEMIGVLKSTLLNQEVTFLTIEDDTFETCFFINKSHIVGIECIEAKDG